MGGKRTVPGRKEENGFQAVVSRQIVVLLVVLLVSATLMLLFVGSKPGE